MAGIKTDPSRCDVIDLRKTLGTQPEVAELLGVSHSTITRAENQAGYPRRRLIWLALRGLERELRLSGEPE